MDNPPPNSSNDQVPNQTIDLTIEDLETLKRCRSESFYYGCIPSMIGSSAAVVFAKKKGFFETRPRLYVPSFLFSLVAGWFVGKLSYMNKCKAMFMELSNSRIKDAYLSGTSPFNKNYRLPNDANTEANKPVVLDFIDENKKKNPSQPMSYAERRNYYDGYNGPVQNEKYSEPKPFESNSVDPNQPKPSTPMSYAERREFYSKGINVPSQNDSRDKRPNYDSSNEEPNMPPKSYSFFDSERSLSSQMNDLDYKSPNDK